MVRVILIRHAQTSWNQVRRIQGGNSDTRLNEEGERQRRCLALKLKTEQIQAVYSSPLRRAMDTARAIADAQGLEVIAEPALKEINCGTLEGTPAREIGNRLRQLLLGGDEGALLFKKCGGESLEELRERAWGAIQRLASRHPDEVIAVVSHYFVIAVILCAVLDHPVSQIGKFRLGETSISTVIFGDSGPYLSLFNDRCHLMAI